NDESQVFAAGVLACGISDENACGRAVGDEYVGVAGYLVPVAANRRAAMPVERPVEKPRRDGRPPELQKRFRFGGAQFVRRERLAQANSLRYIKLTAGIFEVDDLFGKQAAGNRVVLFEKKIVIARDENLEAVRLGGKPAVEPGYRLRPAIKRNIARTDQHIAFGQGHLLVLLVRVADRHDSQVHQGLEVSSARTALINSFTPADWNLTVSSKSSSPFM